MTAKKSAIALILFNLAPIFGVIFLDWDVSAIMILYWSENIVIGFFNVLKMKRAEGPLTEVTARMSINRKPVDVTDRRALIRFFILHYGTFTFVHGIFVAVIFGRALLHPFPILLGTLCLFISHGVSYREHFIDNGEYQRVSFPQLFMQPYKRIVLLHITIIFGGMLALKFEAPPLALMVMVMLKIGIDLALHHREHGKFKPVEPVESINHRP